MATFWQRLASAVRGLRPGGIIPSTPLPGNPYPDRPRLIGGNGRLRPITGLQQLPVYSWTEWDSVQRVRSALANLSQGQFLLPAQLVDAMAMDDRITGVMNARINALLGMPIGYEEGKGVRVSKEVAELRTRMFPRSEVRRLFRSGIMLGVGLAENKWETSVDSHVPTLTWWHPQFIQWRWDTRSFWVTTMTGLEEIQPGNGTWVLYTPEGEQLGWLYGLVRALAIPWLVRQWARRDWARYSEVHGMPIRGAKVPSKAAEEDKERFVTAIAQMSTENAVLLPQGSEEGQSFNIELIEASSQSWEGFKELIAQTDIAIAVAVLGQNLTTEAGTGTKGALATAMVHQDVRQDVIESDSETLSDCLHEHTVEPWSEANYGSAEAAPKATFATDPPDDLDAKSKVLGQVATALQSYRGLQIPLDVKQVLTDYEIPFDEDAEMPDFTEPLEPDPNEAANGAQPTNGAQGKEAPDKEPAKGSEAA